MHSRSQRSRATRNLRARSLNASSPPSRMSQTDLRISASSRPPEVWVWMLETSSPRLRRQPRTPANPGISGLRKKPRNSGAFLPRFACGRPESREVAPIRAPFRPQSAVGIFQCPEFPKGSPGDWVRIQGRLGSPWLPTERDFADPSTGPLMKQARDEAVFH